VARCPSGIVEVLARHTGGMAADLPIEQPTHFELGLTLPPTLLFQADEVLR